MMMNSSLNFLWFLLARSALDWRQIDRGRHGWFEVAEPLRHLPRNFAEEVLLLAQLPTICNPVINLRVRVKLDVAEHARQSVNAVGHLLVLLGVRLNHL